MFRAPALPRTLDAALRDAVDPKPSVRVEAVGELVRHAEEHRETCIAALEKALDDTHPPVRAVALQVLGLLGATELLPAILVACEDADAAVRQEAIATLGAIGDERACGKLERALADARPDVRFQAVMAYPRVCASRGDVIDALVRASRDDDEHVVHVALRMAEEIGGGPAALGDDGEREEDDEDGPADIPPALLERAGALLTHAAPRVRAVAAVVLGRAGDPRGDDALVGVVDGTIATPEAEDVTEAIQLVARRGLARARTALERRAFGGVLGFGRDAWAWHARTALARMGHPRAIRELLRELESRDVARRGLAIVAVGKARVVAARPTLERMGSSDPANAALIERALAALDRAGGTS